MKVTGNLAGLKPSAIRTAERFYRKRAGRGGMHEVVSSDLAHAMNQLSQETGRQVGVLLDRRGNPEHVFIGDAHRLWMPDFGRIRAGAGRLRGLRLIHTHLRNGEGLTNDDLTDLVRLRLDFVAAITPGTSTQHPQLYGAHLLPDPSANPQWRLLDPTPVSQTRLDFLELIAALEEEFARQSHTKTAELTPNGAILVHLHVTSQRQQTRSIEACTAELRELSQTAGINVMDIIVQQRSHADPKYMVGKGKLDDIVLRAHQLGAEILVFDPDLTPGQARAISDATELKVLDRTMVILDIFAQHANSRDGKLQVELAQLHYTLPRLVEKNTMMSRLTGGIGGRGPGETKLEINRRRARERITQLESAIQTLARQREERRSRRKQRDCPVVSIVGYTNAGKSTLLNTLTRADALVANQLFATLDLTSRRLRFPREREVILTDTVGFIHDLPKDLVNAFRATLEELHESDLLLHVVDISNSEYSNHIEAVRQILSDLELSQTPTLLVFNKTDRLQSEELQSRMLGYHGHPASALQAQTLKPLLQAMEPLLWRPTAQPFLGTPATSAEP